MVIITKLGKLCMDDIEYFELYKSYGFAGIYVRAKLIKTDFYNNYVDVLEKNNRKLVKAIKKAYKEDRGTIIETRFSKEFRVSKEEAAKSASN